MNLISRRRPRPLATNLAIGAAVLGALSLANHLVARRSSRRHPPTGAFLNVDGVKLHYTDTGEGSPVVLIHGNMVAGDDYVSSGVAEHLLRNHRVIIFDRPGFGHSERPRGRLWTANAQADLLLAAVHKLGVNRPIVVGHSWGAIVAMSMAVRHEEKLAGVVALGGYYFGTLRPDVLPAALGALPVFGDILRYTVAPLLNWLIMPLTKRALFAPGAVTSRFEAAYSTAMAVRPSQIRATSQDGALMIQRALMLQDHYKNLRLPVAIVAGEGDIVVFRRNAEWLRDAIEGSELHVVKGAGHMVHHQAPLKVAEAVEAVAQRAFEKHGASSDHAAPAEIELEPV